MNEFTIVYIILRITFSNVMSTGVSEVRIPPNVDCQLAAEDFARRHKGEYDVSWECIPIYRGAELKKLEDDFDSSIKRLDGIMERPR